MRVSRNLDCSRLGDRSLLPWSKIVSTQAKFFIWIIRATFRDDNRIRIGDTKKYIVMRERVWCHEILILCFTTGLFLLIFFVFSSTRFEISLFSCTSVRGLTLVVADSSFEIEEFLHKMAISLKNCRFKQQNHSFLANWPDSRSSSHNPLWFLENWPVHLPWIYCAHWSTFGLRRISSFTLSLYPFCSRHNSRRRSLSMLVPRKKWTVPQLTGVYSIVRVPRDLDCTHLVDWSRLPWSRKGFNSSEGLYLHEKRNAQRWQWNMNGTQENKAWWLIGTVWVSVGVS